MPRLRLILGTIGSVLLLIAALLLALDTPAGHRFVARQIAGVEPQNGLRIEVERIDGSLFGKADITGLKLRDTRGLFFEAPHVTLHWRPLAWLTNRLDVEQAHAERATLYRLPKLRPARPDAPILPDFDVRIGRLAIDRLDIRSGVNGRPATGQLAGRLTLHAGRALVDINARASQGDRLSLNLNAVPDANQLDVGMVLDTPQNGVIGKLFGTRAPLSIRLDGAGDWQLWTGKLTAQMAGKEAALLNLRAQAGRYALDGRVMASALPKGRLQALAAPYARLSGTAQLAKRRLKGTLSMSAPALRLTARGGVNLANSGFEDVLIAGELAQPQALGATIAGRPVALKLLLDGSFRYASFDYLLTAPELRFGNTGLENVRASGQGRLSRAPVRVPIRLSAQRITGVGNVAGGILANISINGTLLATSTTLIGDGLALTSDKLSGKIALFVDWRTGRYDVGLAGQLSRFLIPGIGVVDVRSTLDVVPGANGKGTRILGRGEAWVRRFDNAFFAGLAGGLPKLETGLERTPDGVLRFTNMRLTAPQLSLTLTGVRLRDGRFQLAGSGLHQAYGPVQLGLEGPISRPRISLALARPNAALGLASVRLTLNPNAQGYTWQADGGSRLGRFTGAGDILLPLGGRSAIRVARLDVGGVSGSGVLLPSPGGLNGTLALAGTAQGSLVLDIANGRQRIRANFEATNARFSGPPALAIGRGRFAGTILLNPRGTEIEGNVSARAVQYGGLDFARLSGTVRLNGDNGELRGEIAGARGQDYNLTTAIRLSPNRVAISGGGSLGGRPIQLDAPAILLREARGWRLAPSALRFAGGRAELSGLLGGAQPEVTAVVDQMPLDILDIVAPRLGLGGRASGTLIYAEDADGDPTGRIDLKVRGLTRAGLALASRPVDLAIAATMSNGTAGARMVAALGGQTIGRAQMRLSGLRGTDPLGTRIANAAVSGQLRYNGDASTLWRLTGIAGFDLSGPVALGADIGGRLADPIIQGSVRTNTARIESAAAGMVLTNVSTIGRFDGSQLVFDSFSAAAGRNGRVTGAGRISFSSLNRGMDIALDADNASLIARDDLSATVTGPLRIRADASGGVISGTVRLNRSAYVLGQSSAVTSLPRLNVREVNGVVAADTPAASAQVWTLDIKAEAPGRLMVSGLGLDSEWRANLLVQGSIFSPAITGAAEMIRGGYEFAGRRFDLQRGIIRFRGESPPDPILDIVAQGDTQGLTATIRVAGTGQRPDISFASVPALPQEELLSRLLFGTSITSLSAPEAVQLAAAVASMRGGAGLNPINALRKAVGLDRLRILPGNVATGQRTSVAAGKYLTRRTFVEVITDGQGYSATRAEFQVTRWLSILSTISTLGEQSASVRVSRDY